MSRLNENTRKESKNRISMKQQFIHILQKCVSSSDDAGRGCDVYEDDYTDGVMLMKLII